MNIKMGNGSSILMSDKGDSVKSIFQDDKDIVAKQTADIKMADVFSGDVVADADSLIASGYGVLADFSGYKKACRYTAVAINSYDTNQALIDKQAEQIKMLIELVDSANEKLGSVRDALYGQNLSISGWHLNGELEPVDNWFDSNDWEPIECIEITKEQA